jgi:O-antigen/teichoic acid export membrane protein
MTRFKSIFDEVRPTLTLAVPIIVGHVSQMLMGITDSVMIGQTGTVPLAASSFGGNVFGVFYIVGIGLMIPVAVFVARARGAARPLDCGEYLRHGLALALAFGVLETLAMVALGWQLHWFQQPPEVLAVVNPFFWLIGAVDHAGVGVSRVATIRGGDGPAVGTDVHHARRRRAEHFFELDFYLRKTRCAGVGPDGSGRLDVDFAGARSVGDF